MKTKQTLFRTWTFGTGILLLSLCCGHASAQVLFYDNFQQFTNGTDLTVTNYVPVSGPASASALTWIDNGSPRIVATNFLGRRWAFFDNSVLTNKDDYRGYLSTVQSNQLLEITWKMWIQATNSGLGMFLLSVPVHDPQNPNIDYNPPLILMDSGAIVAATNSAPGVSTNGTFVITAPVIGNWASLAGTVMTNQLILDYPDGTFSYSLNGQMLASLPLGPYFTNLVDSITFTGIERDASSLGNRFAIGDVNVQLVAPAADFAFTTNDGSITITGYTGLGGDVLIPSTITGLPVTSIGPYAFENVTNLTNVTMDTNLTSIEFEAFAGCASLVSVMIPANVTNVADFAFDDCTNLTAIIVNTNNPAYRSVDGVLFNQNQSTLFQYPEGRAGSYVIPVGTTRIGTDAFQICAKLTSVTIPATVSNIETYAFYYCPSLTAITVDANNPAYSSLDGILFNHEQSTLIQYPGGRSGNYTIPTGVTGIGTVAFDSCVNLTGVTIPMTVTNIGVYAFYECPSLTGIYFQGNAPGVVGNVIDTYDSHPTAYYLAGTFGWENTFGGIPAVLWNPHIEEGGAGFGVRTNHFGFDITGASNLTVLVEASTNLANPVWSPVETNTLTNGSSYFNDLGWTNYPVRFYRLNVP